MTFQLGSPLLDACVLAVLKKGDSYGYELTQTISEVIEISDSTLYPILRRLTKDGCLETYDLPFQGRNRRYYKLTNKGLKICENYISDWTEYKKKIDHILLGGVEND